MDMQESQSAKEVEPSEQTSEPSKPQDPEPPPGLLYTPWLHEVPPGSKLLKVIRPNGKEYPAKGK